MPRKKKEETVEETKTEATQEEAVKEETPAVEEKAAAVKEEAPAAEEKAADEKETAEKAPKKKPETKAKTKKAAAKKEEKAAAPEDAEKGGRKRAEKIGVVFSDKMIKTVVVRVDRLVKHPMYRKYVKKRKKFMAHNELGAGEGDKVRIVETRPLSAKKRWRVVEIIQKAEK